MIIGIAIFAIQNSNASVVTIKFLLWRFDTSLVYTVLGSIGLGISSLRSPVPSGLLLEEKRAPGSILNLTLTVTGRG
jgi:hypothetical protein